MKSRSTLALLALPLCAGLAAAQNPGWRSLSIAFKRNQEELQRYTWQSRTEISVDGEVQQVTLFEARFDGDGNEQKTRIGGEEDKVGGPIGKRKARRKRKKSAELSKELRKLIHSYTHLTPKHMQEVFSRAIVWRGQVGNEGLTRLQTRDVVRQGDTMDVWVNSATRKPHKFEIVTSLEGEPVSVVTEFREIAGGPACPAQTVVTTEVKNRSMVIKTENFAYSLPGD